MEKTEHIFDENCARILLGEQTFVYTRFGLPRRLRVRALTLREIILVNEGSADYWQLAIGKPAKWLRKLHPLEAERLALLVQELNEPPEIKSSAKPKSDGNPETEKADDSLQRILYSLVCSGHNPQALLDYTFPQLVFWSQVARQQVRLKMEDVGLQTVAIRNAVWGNEAQFGKFQKFVNDLAKGV